MRMVMRTVATMLTTPGARAAHCRRPAAPCIRAHAARLPRPLPPAPLLPPGLQRLHLPHGLPQRRGRRQEGRGRRAREPPRLHHALVPQRRRVGLHALPEPQRQHHAARGPLRRLAQHQRGQDLRREHGFGRRWDISSAGVSTTDSRRTRRGPSSRSTSPSSCCSAGASRAEWIWSTLAEERVLPTPAAEYNSRSTPAEDQTQ